jgi:hypothetical protein
MILYDIFIRNIQIILTIILPVVLLDVKKILTLKKQVLNV